MVLPGISGCLAAAGVALALIVAPALSRADPLAGPGSLEILSAEGIPVSAGAAAGYVPDHVCAECHADKAESFAEMGMARSFQRPSKDTVVEDFSALPYFHEPSGRYYQMELRGEDYVFTRYAMAADGSVIDRFTVTVDWILGSGNHSRIYIYRTPDGALFQLPLSWYSQEGEWAMAPGFEFAQHSGVLRAVSKRCMACHNGHADYPEGSGMLGVPLSYPEDLPEGIGCQRCHGPGAEHVAAALGGESGLADLRLAIVNPGKLPRERLYSICYGCHMQPTVTLNSQPRLGRGHFSFRPGEQVTDFIADIDIVDPEIPAAERFEINHHPYRLEQSECFIASEGRLGCLTCHDPHVKVKPEERAAHYRKACLSCHETDAEGLPDIAATEARHPPISRSDDCTACHMPDRRTQDVVEVTMTDHKISREPPPREELLRPLQSERVNVAEVLLPDPEGNIPEAEALILKLVSILDYTKDRAAYASDDLETVLVRSGIRHYEPWLVLMQSYNQQRRLNKSRRIAGHVLSLAPDNPGVITSTAFALFLTGERERAIEMLRDLLRDRPGTVGARFNLARFMAIQGRHAEALNLAQSVTRLRPNHWQAWDLIARLATIAGDDTRAIEAHVTALEIRPRSGRIRATMVEALRAAGRHDEAARHADRLPD